PGEAYMSGRRCGRPDTAFRRLLDYLNDPARTRFDQYGPTVHNGVTIGRDAEALRHVVISHAAFRQHTADDNAIRNGIDRDMFAHDIVMKRRALIGRDAVDVAVDNDAAVTHDADGVLCVRRDRRAHRGRDRRDSQYLVPHIRLLRDDACRLATARKPTQFIARGIVPKKLRVLLLRVLAIF